MIRLAIVGCSESKYSPGAWGKAHPDHEPGDSVDTLPLEYLYSSGYWTVKRNYAQAVAEDWRVLSAGLGLAHPSRPMEDEYDRTLHNMSDDEIAAWAAEVEPDLRAFVKPYADREAVVDVLLGSTYLEPIEDVLEDLPVDVGYPFAGTAGMGEQMSELNELADAYESGEDIDVPRTQPQV